LPSVPRSVAPITDYTPPPSRRVSEAVQSTSAYPPAANSVAGGKTALLNDLKEELFALESERLNGTVSPEEYAETKAGLEAVLKRALKKQ
jgi:hypothetical protein